MKTIFWKEFRENKRWALFGGIIFGLLIYMVMPKGHQDSYAPICSFDSIFIPVGALLGGALGLLQILPELKRDQWAYLIHRPVSRDTIFWGKVGAGTTLYLLATLLPFIIAVWWWATPGHICGPFDPHMIETGLIDLVLGLVYYLAGFLAGILEGRWLGTKCLGLLAAILCTLFITASFEVWQAVWLILGFGIVMLGAAWACFRTTGRYEGQARWGQASLALIVFFGLLICGLISYSLLRVDSWFHHDQLSTRYQIGKKGEVLKVIWDHSSVIQVQDLNGIEVKPVPKEPPFDGDYFLNEITISPNSVPSVSYRDSDRYVVQVSGHRVKDAGRLWFYVPKQRVALGYSEKFNVEDMVAAPNGIQSIHQPIIEHFPVGKVRVDGSLWTFQDRVYWVDLMRSEVYVPYICQAGEELIGVNYFGEIDHKNVVGVATSKTFLLVLDGVQQIELPYAADPHLYSQIRALCARHDQKYFVWQSVRLTWVHPEYRFLPSYLSEYAADGHLVKTYQLPAIVESEEKKTFAESFQDGFTPIMFLLGNQVVKRLGAAWGIPDCIEERAKLNYNWKEEAVAGLLALAGAFAAMVGAWWIARIYRLPSKVTAVWLFLIFWMGPFGLATFWVVRNWPTRLVCPSCGCKRRVDLVTCEHCSVPWPKPALDGTEIMKPLLP